jgi:hypothetical protein
VAKPLGTGYEFLRDDPAGRALYKRLANETSGDRRGAVEGVTRLFDEHAAQPLVNLIRKCAPDISELAALDTPYSNAPVVYGARRLAINAASRGDQDEVLRQIAKGRAEAESIARVAGAAIAKSAESDAGRAILSVTKPKYSPWS